MKISYSYILLCHVVSNTSRFINILQGYVIDTGAISQMQIVGSDNGLSPLRHQAVIWTSAGLLSIDPWE